MTTKPESAKVKRFAEHLNESLKADDANCTDQHVSATVVNPSSNDRRSGAEPSGGGVLSPGDFINIPDCDCNKYMLCNKHIDAYARCHAAMVEAQEYGEKRDGMLREDGRQMNQMQQQIDDLKKQLRLRTLEIEICTDEAVTALNLVARKLQPAGSPPPGGWESLMLFIVDHVNTERDELRAWNERLRKALQMSNAYSYHDCEESRCKRCAEQALIDAALDAGKKG